MLKKILHIKNLGLFNNATCTSTPFDRATLIYAENGRGKSTLASILRSCATSDTASISLRQSLDSNNAPEIKLFFENGTSRTQAVFDGNIWSFPYSDILVFDAEFVDKNVYSGTAITTSHRQELLEFALGEDAVQLKQKVDSEAQNASEKSKEIANIERQLASHRNGMPLETFANLQPDLNVDQEIDSLQTRLAVAKNNEALQGKKCPELLIEPQLDLGAFFEIFSTTLEDIEKDSEETVRSHINKYSNGDFENWLSQGQLFGHEDNCPYCGQALINDDLLKAYKNHFNQAYKDLKYKVSNLVKDIEKRLSDVILDRLISIVEKNNSLANEWTEHVDSQKFELDKDALLDIFKQIRDLFYKLARVKQQNPLDTIESDAEKNQAMSLWNQVLLAVRSCNDSIKISTDRIIDFKSKLAGENIQEIQQKIEELKLVKIRQELIVCDLIQQWNSARVAKQLYEQQKVTARNELDSLMTETLQQYQTKINTLVNKFGALFEIYELSHDYRGTGLPRSNYGLKVKGRDVKLSADTAPSFSTALSEGDKRTLAFAFFIARIEADANLNSKIIVVDDPVCSLDRNRRSHTKRILREIGMKSAQLIVLGHDSHFLRDLRDDLQDSRVNISTQLLKIIRVTNDFSDFSTFDIDRECASGYYRNHKILQDFVNGETGDDLYVVARSIRPLLEGYLHRRFPGHVQRNKLFGQIIGDAKAAQLPNPLVYLKPLAAELYAINDYAGQFHHDTNAADDTTSINESELRSYAERALAVIYRGEPRS
jgi:wobble nucleotide-excising tRNase